MRRYLTGWTMMGLAMIGGATAQTVAVLPANAVASRHGLGWQCLRGHERIDKVCNPLQVPEHAFLTFSGDGWQCERQTHDFLRAVRAICFVFSGYLFVIGPFFLGKYDVLKRSHCCSCS